VGGEGPPGRNSKEDSGWHLCRWIRAQKVALGGKNLWARKNYEIEQGVQKKENCKAITECTKKRRAPEKGRAEIREKQFRRARKSMKKRGRGKEEVG